MLHGADTCSYASQRGEHTAQQGWRQHRSKPDMLFAQGMYSMQSL
jgi:hypothetical protein